MSIAWRDTMSVNDPHLDHQHKLIINTLAVLEKGRTQRNSAAIFTVFSNLLPYFKKHFKEEEEFFDRINYPQRDWHKSVHQGLIQEAEKIYGLFARAPDDESRFAAATMLEGFIQDYIFGHMVKEDIKARPFTRIDPSSDISVVVLHERSEEAYRQRRQRRDSDIEYHLPPHLEHLLKRIAFDVPELAPPQGDFETFQALCESAIFRRLDRVLLFFQRRNTEMRRELPPLFLLSHHFRPKFQAAIRELIFPTLWQSRQVRLAAASLDLSGIDNESFWTRIEPTLRADISYWWGETWRNMRPVMGRREADGRTVLKIRDNLKRLRDMLQPDEAEQYDMPKVAQQELNLFASLLDTDVDWWEKLDLAWKIFVDLYEQEKDPRVFQQKAREGALRDAMLESFDKFPSEWLDFLLMCCHANFPRVTSMFLGKFTTNYSNREALFPYTMRYLDMIAGRSDVRHREMEAEAEYQRQREELRVFLTRAEK
jgi:hemerythrin-like metal-binding protein